MRKTLIIPLSTQNFKLFCFAHSIDKLWVSSGIIRVISNAHNEIFYLFQAGLVGVLVKEFRTPILVTLLYIGLSIAFHVWSLNVRWYDPRSYWWTDGLLALFVIQRSSKPPKL